MFLFHREVPIKSIAFVGIGLIMLIGLSVGVYIVNTQQTDSRSKASTAGSATLQNFVSGVSSSISLNTQPFGVSDRNTSNVESTPSNCCGGNVMKVTYEGQSDVENRFEIVFPEKIVEVLGLGTLDQLESPNTPYLPDKFADNEFGLGHLQMGSHDEYNGDRGRMKTPMVVFPTKKLLIAYLYNDLTQIRFERAAKTTLVIKKKYCPQGLDEQGKSACGARSNYRGSLQQLLQGTQRRRLFLQKAKLCGLWSVPRDVYGHELYHEQSGV